MCLHKYEIKPAVIFALGCREKKSISVIYHDVSFGGTCIDLKC